MVPRSSLAADEREAIERIRNRTATEDDYRLFHDSRGITSSGIGYTIGR